MIGEYEKRLRRTNKHSKADFIRKVLHEAKMTLKYSTYLKKYGICFPRYRRILQRNIPKQITYEN